MPHKDPEARRDYYRAYRERKRQEINARWRAWARENAERRRPRLAEQARRRRLQRKREVLKLSGGKCVYCERDLTPGEVTLDHVVPVSAGGGNGRNLVPSCFRCNRDKGDRTPEEWQPDRDFPLLRRVAPAPGQED